MLTSRCYSIIQNIAESRRKFKVTDLAALYGVSSRVIYYDIDAIKDYLHERNDFRLNVEDGYISIICNNQVKLTDLLDRIQCDAKTNILLTPEERMLEILLKILNEETVRIAAMVEAFLVSKTTIVKDFDTMKMFFRKKGVKLKATADGFKFFSDEIDVRIASVNFVMTLLKPNYTIYRLYDDRLLWQMRPYYIFMSQISFEDLVRAVRTAIATEFVSYNIFNICILGISIGLIRDNLDCTAEISDNSSALLADTSIYHLAEKVNSEIQNYTEIKDEKGFVDTIAILLLGAQIDYEPILYLNKRIDFKVAASNFVVDVCNKVGFEADKALITYVRNDLFQFLIKADSTGIHKMDKTIKQMEDEYPDLLAIIKGSSYIFANVLGFQLDEKQYAMLAMNFIEQYDLCCQKKLSIPRALVVCNAGSAGSRLISSRLQSFFEIQIVGIISIYEVGDFLKEHEVDYVITSVPLAVLSIPCIQVNSYLSEEDIVNLSRIFSLKKLNYETINEIVELVEEYGTLNNRQEFMEKAAVILNIDKQTAQTDNRLNLYQVIEESCILLDGEFTELSEAVEVSGEMLYGRDYIEAEYIQEIVETVKNSGRYMLIGEQIIMPHSLAGKHVKKTGISIVRLRESLPLYDRPEIEVKWIFTLCTIDKVSHLTALTQLAQILGTSSLLKEMESIKSKLQLLNLLQEHSIGDVL